MRIILGIIFIVVSCIGTLFFSRYKGEVIANPTLWYIFFIMIGALGIWFIYISFKRADRIITGIEESKIEKLKINSEKIILEFDFCEFKSGSYYHEIIDESIRPIDLIGPGLLHNPTVSENVVQSSIIYNYTTSGSTEKFISQSFPVDHTTLKFYVLNHKVILYTNKFDRSKYFFELQN